MRSFFPILLAWGSCDIGKDTADTGLPEGCEAVSAACPPDGGRSYWSSCDGGGWDEVDQCREDGICIPAPHGEIRMEDGGESWSDVWASCDPGFTQIEGVICCL